MIINGKEINAQTLAGMIDESSLRSIRLEDADAAIAKAKKYGFRALYCPDYMVSYCAEHLKGSGVLVGTALDGPFGASSAAVKTAMIKDAIKRGTDDIDVSINSYALKAKNYDLVVEELKAVVDACDGHTSKIICEVKDLTDEQMLAAAECVQKAGADYYKTSAWFGGADMSRLVKLRAALSDAKLKVSGTGNFWMTAILLGSLAAGGDIFGCHDGEQLINELPLFEEIYSKIQF